MTLQLQPISLPVFYAKIQNVIKRRGAEISQQQKYATLDQLNSLAFGWRTGVNILCLAATVSD